MIRMERGAAVSRIPNQKYYYNSEVQTADTGVEIWSFTSGEFRKVRRSDKNVINPDPSAKSNAMDPRSYDVYLIDKNRIETDDSDSLYLPLGSGGGVAVTNFTYRIVDAPLLLSELRLTKRQYSHSALKKRIFEAILDCMEKFGIPAFRQETLGSEVAAYASRLYKFIQENTALGYLGVELLSLKISLK